MNWYTRSIVNYTGATFNSDTVLGDTFRGLGIRPDATVMGGRVLAEVISNTNTNDITLNYFGPQFHDTEGDGLYLPGTSEHTILTISGSSTTNVSAPLAADNEQFSPLSGNAGFRMQVASSSWDGSAEIHFHLVLAFLR